MRTWRSASKKEASAGPIAAARMAFGQLGSLRVSSRVGGLSLGLGLGLVVGLGLTLSACGLDNSSPGVEPPNDELFFPQGILLDPRVPLASAGACTQQSECAAGQSCTFGACREAARWLFVANGNSDLTFNAGTMIPFDLDGLFDALADTQNIGAPGSTPTADKPCRRARLEPQLLECEESFFAQPDASIHFGAFAMQPAAWDCEVIESSPAAAPGETRPQRRVRYCDPDEAMLLTPINGDPSVTYSYISGGLNGADDLRIECGQGSGSGQADSRRCSDDFRIRKYRNDDDSVPIPRELTTMRVMSDPHTPWAFITHRANAALSLLKLDGIRGAQDTGDARDPYGELPAQAEQSSERPKPAFVDIQSAFLNDNGGGGFGLAERPCDPDDAPVETNGCTRPLVYGGYRNTPFFGKFSSVSLNVGDLTAEQSCLEEGAVPGPGEVDCDPKVLAVDLAVPSGALSNLGGAQIFGDLLFSEDGEELFIVQSTPGALIRVNTGVDALGRTLDEPNAFVELCDRPSMLTIYDDGAARYGLTTCFSSALVYIVDLDTMTVVRQLRAGTGPNRMLTDLAREVVYVANTLDATVSVIDMSRDNPTRFTQIARLGLQEPFDP